MSLNVGETAPDFALPDSNGNLVRLADFWGRRVVLYFYPRDSTPGCTQEACGFRDAYGEYEAIDAIVLGISTDNKIYRKVKPEPHATDVLADFATLSL